MFLKRKSVEPNGRNVMGEKLTPAVRLTITKTGDMIMGKSKIREYKCVICGEDQHTDADETEENSCYDCRERVWDLVKRGMETDEAAKRAKEFNKRFK